MGLFDSIFRMAAQKDAQAFEHQEAALNRQFQSDEAKLAYERSLEADSTKYTRQVQDLQNAGINPMMAVSSGAGSVQASPASGSSAHSPGIAHADIPGVMDLAQLQMQRNLNEAQVRNINANTANTEADTAQKESSKHAIDLANEITEATKEARIEAAKLSNDLTHATISKIHAQLGEISEHIHLMAEQADTEASKRHLNAAQAALAHANAQQIVQLLPYEKALREAQTESQRQAALLSAAHAAYQNKLIDDGYIDAFIAEQKSKATTAEAKAELEQIKTAMRTGDWSKLPGYLGNEPDNSTITAFMSGFTILLDNLNPLNNVFK